MLIPVPAGLTFTVPESKIVRYLLSPTQPKAAFFLSIGFSPARPHDLARALLDHPTTAHTIGKPHPGGWGLSLICDGPLRFPDGRDPFVRTVWLETAGTARFVTAYPRTAKAPPAPP